MFNFSVLEQLIGFSQEAFVHLSPAVAQLIRSTPVEMQKLIQCYQQQDHKAVEHLLHKLRGSYATLGATALPQLSRTLEQALHQHKQLPSAEEFALYLDCLQQTCSALDLWLQQFQQSSEQGQPDLQLFIQYLEQSDMQAYSLFQQQRAGWIDYLGPEEFVQTEQDIMTLNFTAVAKRLRDKLTKGDAG